MFLSYKTCFRYVAIDGNLNDGYSHVTYKLVSVSLDSAVPSVNGIDKVTHLEHCTCPEGYTGMFFLSALLSLTVRQSLFLPLSQPLVSHCPPISLFLPLSQPLFSTTNSLSCLLFRVFLSGLY